MIYQLAHTSPYLGGQIRLDMMVNGRQATGLHVVPLSDSITFNESNSRDTLKYSHLDNIKYLYDLLGDDMFRDCNAFGDQRLWSYNPSDVIELDTFDHTYNSGLRRLRYKRYDKQMSFLCPLWVAEKDFDAAKLSFVFHIGPTYTVDATGEETPIIYFNPNDNRSYRASQSQTVSLSDGLVSYINTYLQAGRDTSSSVDSSNDLLYIDYTNMESWVKGIYAPSGTPIYKDTKVLLGQILNQELPLMDFDALLCGTLVDNKIVAQQLLNLNFCFNLEDVVSSAGLGNADFESYNIWVDVLYDGDVVEYRDIYSNYDDIPGWRINPPGTIESGGRTGQPDANNNVLDYFLDTKAINNIYKNKVTQPIFHWAFTDNDKYTYNLYNGFSPFLGTAEKNKYQMTGHYFDTPDFNATLYDPLANNIGWCSVLDFINTSTPLDDGVVEHDVEYYKKNYTKIPIYNNTTALENDRITWIGNTKYNTKTITAPSGALSGVEDYFYCAILVADTNQWKDSADVIVGTLLGTPISDTNRSFIITGPRSLEDGTTVNAIQFLIDRNELDLVTFKNIMNSTLDNDYIIYIKSILKNIIQPSKIMLESSASIYRAAAPIKTAQEVTYDYRQKTKKTVYLYRYSGKIIPQFIPVGNDSTDYRENYKYYYNNAYHFTTWSDQNKPDNWKHYNDMLATGYDPNYPSIDFYSLEKEKCDPYTLPLTYQDKDYREEICWYRANRIFLLPSTLVTTFSKTIGSGDIDTDELLLYAFRLMLKTTTLNTGTLVDDGEYDYIKDYYNYNIVYDYDDTSADAVKNNKMSFKITWTLR